LLLHRQNLVNLGEGVTRRGSIFNLRDQVIWDNASALGRTSASSLITLFLICLICLVNRRYSCIFCFLLISSINLLIGLIVINYSGSGKRVVNLILENFVRSLAVSVLRIESAKLAVIFAEKSRQRLVEEILVKVI